MIFAKKHNLLGYNIVYFCRYVKQHFGHIADYIFRVKCTLYTIAVLEKNIATYKLANIKTLVSDFNRTRL